MKMDRVLGIGKSDPYAIITVGSQEFRTKTIYNTVNPKWDFYCEVSSKVVHAIGGMLNWSNRKKN
jgi:Ca2+-dependent lipid-binding protein